MSIKNIRLNRLIDKVIQTAVQSGYIPSSKEVIHRINDYIFNHNLNEPLYRFKRVKSKDTVSSAQYNQTLDDIYNDLSILYEICESNYNALDAAKNKYEIFKKRLEYEIKCLTDELQTIIATYNNKGISECLFDTFNDTSKIDKDNTTAIIDNGVKIKNVSSKTSIITQIPTVSYTTIGTHTTIYGNIQDIVNTEAHFAWIAAQCNGLKLTFDFSQYQTSLNDQIYNGALIDRIEIETATKCLAKLSYTPDGQNIFDLPYYENPRELQKVYEFPRILVKQLFIELSNSADLTYHIDNIKFIRIGYTDQAQLVSNQLTSTKNISKLALSVDAETPDSTSIDYYIKVDDEWIQVSSLEDPMPKYPQVLDLMNTEKASQILKLSSEKSETEYEITSLRYNGIRFYSLGQINHQPFNDILYKGKNACIINNCIIPVDRNRNFYMAPDGTSHIYFYILCQTNTTFNTIPISNTPTTIMVNGTTIADNIILGSKIITINLLRGWNKIDIYLENGWIDLGFNPSMYGNVYAYDMPMQRVELIDLQRTVLKDDHSKYALDDQNRIIVNHYMPDIEYEYTYEFAAKQINSIQFKAVLKRNQSNISPTLKAYYINVV